MLSDIGVLSCDDARTGVVVYRGRVPATGGTYNASSVAAGGWLYLAHADRTVYVVRAGPTLEIAAANPMGEVLMATPAIAEGMILIRTRQHLVAVASDNARGA